MGSGEEVIFEVDPNEIPSLLDNAGGIGTDGTPPPLNSQSPETPASLWSSWGVCSAECEGGIQRRACLQEACDGPSVRTCNTASCLNCDIGKKFIMLATYKFRTTVDPKGMPTKAVKKSATQCDIKFKYNKSVLFGMPVTVTDKRRITYSLDGSEWKISSFGEKGSGTSVS